MPLESVNFIEDMNAAWPTGTDPKNEGDNHLRNIKNGVLNSFPNTTGIWTTTNKITMGGADMTGVVVSNVGNAVATGDAVNLGTLNARQPGFTSWGSVGADGTSANTPGSGDWTSVRLSAGVYQIVFQRAVSGASRNQAITLAPYGTNDDRTCTADPQPDLVTLQVRTYSGNGAATDVGFSFSRTVN
jgi:hypothetical protein